MNTAAEHSARSTATRHGREWLKKLARLGYASRGVVYVIIGGLALMAALGQGGQITGTRGAILQVFDFTGGWLLVLVMAIGLAGYSAWRFCQSVLDADGHGKDGKALVIRAGLFASSVTHLLLAIWAGKLAIGQAVSSDSGGSEESMVAKLMSQPYGPWLVGAVGLILIGAGLAQFAKGHKETFEKYFAWDYEERRKLIMFCKVGLFARGVIFAIIGGFIVYAAVTVDPSNAGGLQEALVWLRSQPFGPWLLGLVAAGLICFGIYSFVEAAYRRVQPNV